MSCAMAQHDGSYILGALSPADRQAFEQHLVGCAECAQSVRELAGLPGLLARISPDLLDDAPAPDPVPETLLPALVRQVRQTQRRRRWVTAGVAAAAAAAITVGSIAVTTAVRGDHVHAATVAAGRPMVPVGHAPVRAVVSFQSVPWGTRLILTCTYAPSTERYELAPAPTYALFVHTRQGQTEQVAAWRSPPDKTMRLTAASAANLKDITSVDVRTEAGRTVLRLTS